MVWIEPFTIKEMCPELNKNIEYKILARSYIPDMWTGYCKCGWYDRGCTRVSPLHDIYARQIHKGEILPQDCKNVS